MVVAVVGGSLGLICDADGAAFRHARCSHKGSAEACQGILGKGCWTPMCAGHSARGAEFGRATQAVWWRGVWRDKGAFLCVDRMLAHVQTAEVRFV